MIKRKEDKKALQTKPGFSKKPYHSISVHCDVLNTHESTDRRLVFELTGHKLNLDGAFIEDTHIAPTTRDTYPRDPSHLCKHYY